MADRQKSHFGYDGYKELYAKEELAKSKNASYSMPYVEKAKERSKDLMKLRKEEQKRKSKDPRAAKLIHPGGTGRRKQDTH